MDRYDRSIIELLVNDGRLSWARIAERVNLSASACQRRVEALQKQGVIQQYTVMLNQKALGNQVRAFVAVNVERQDTASSDAFRKHLLQHPQVQSAHMISGTIDFMLEVVAADLEALAKFIDDDLLRIPAVRDVTSSIVLQEVKPHIATLG